MKSLFLILLLALLIPTTYAKDQAAPLPLQQCINQAPYGFPQTSRLGVTICRHAYVTLNDMSAKLPIWVSYVLEPKNALGCILRSNSFAPDASLPKGQRAELKDYAGSGFDIGHTAPDGDMSFDIQAETESFILSNMTPQYPHTNRGNWKFLETSIRGWVVQSNQSFTIYAGPIYNDTDKTIGVNKVVVPHAFYKIVINNITGDAAGWIFPNSNTGDNNIVKLRAPIILIQQQVGIKFPLPFTARELSTGQEWPVNFGQLTKAKKAKCSPNS
jgi:endonuclease G